MFQQFPHRLLRFASICSALVTGCGTTPPIFLSISPSSAQAIDQSQNVAITATIINDFSGKGVSWTLNGPGSLSNMTGPSVTYISPASAITSADQVSVTAASVADPTKTASLQITVNPYPLVPFQNLANGIVGALYSQPILFTGGTAPFQWSIYNGPIATGHNVGGTVPDGLMLNPGSGNITGTPTGAGTWYFEAVLTDATGVSVDQPFLSVEITSPLPPGSPVPFLNQPLVPTAAALGGPAFTLSVSGTGFSSNSTVNFNHTALATTFVNSQRLTAAVPAASVANAGTAVITVVTPVPGGESNVIYFPIGAPTTAVSFAPAKNSPLTILEPYAIVAGDFNEDGKPDLLVSAPGTLNVFLGNGDGTFNAASGSPMRLPSPPYDDFASPYLGPIALGDFNKSGHQGLAVSEFNNEAAVILFGKGDGTFVVSSASFANSLGLPGVAVEAVDFNADGNLDLALVNEISGQSPVALGYGSGAFNTAGDLNVGMFAMGAAVGDFNADGKLDLIAAGGGTGAFPDSGLAISLGNGDGTFTTPNNSPISLGQSLSAIVTADFNGDGKLDIAATDSVGNVVFILLGNGDGTFGPPLSIPVGNDPIGIVAADFNNDGKLDLAIANSGDNTITLLLGNGDGTFTPSAGSPYTVATGPYGMAVADFNGDGKLDLAITSSAGTVSILLQQ